MYYIIIVTSVREKMVKIWFPFSGTYYQDMYIVRWISKYKNEPDSHFSKAIFIYSQGLILFLLLSH